jgi:hypothetical protein
MSEKVNIYKMVVMVFDFDRIELNDIINELENSKYFVTYVRDVEHRVIEDFTDDHPINKTATAKETFYKMFENDRHIFIDSLSEEEYTKIKKAIALL